MTIENREYYDHFAESYDDHRGDGYHLMVDDLETSLIMPFAKGADVLEVGCGTGLILERVAPVAQSHVGIDLSPGMLEHAARRGLNTRVASATELPFEDSSFDLSYSFKVLSHVPELKLATSEMSRVTRPGGRVFIELYNRQSIRYLIRRLRGGASIGGGIDDNQVFFRFYNLDEMQAALPSSLHLVQIHGVRVFTVLPSALRWPGVGPLLRRLEGAALSSFLARYGGFLVLECERR